MVIRSFGLLSHWLVGFSVNTSFAGSVDHSVGWLFRWLFAGTCNVDHIVGLLFLC